MEKGKRTGKTGTPAANAAVRKKEDTSGSQRGRRGNSEVLAASKGGHELAPPLLADHTTVPLTQGGRPMSSDASSADETRRPAYPQLAPTLGFRCDLCGDLIGDTRDAWGQWYSQQPADPSGKSQNWGFSIVHGEAHAPACSMETRTGPSIGDEELDYLLSADGFTYLLEFFVEREVDNEELSRFMLRLFAPGYEQAFRLISPAIADDLHEPRGNRYFLSQSEITRIVDAHAEGRFDTYT